MKNLFSFDSHCQEHIATIVKRIINSSGHKVLCLAEVVELLTVTGGTLSLLTLTGALEHLLYALTVGTFMLRPLLARHHRLAGKETT